MREDKLAERVERRAREAQAAMQRGEPIEGFKVISAFGDVHPLTPYLRGAAAEILGERFDYQIVGVVGRAPVVMIGRSYD